ncbi:hypothetical protein AHAS_Ahas09G0218800 [Arachis hypogaea]
MAVSSMSLGASMNIFSSQVLFYEKLIDQTIDTRIKLAYALARQWFGVYITPESRGTSDEWLLDGLFGFLTDFLLRNIWAIMRRGIVDTRFVLTFGIANCAVCKVDSSGTHCMGLYGKIRSWKAVAILQMLEKQMGLESFRRVRFLGISQLVLLNSALLIMMRFSYNKRKNIVELAVLRGCTASQTSST